MNQQYTPDYPDGASQTPVEGSIKALATLFPSVVREGVVDFDALKQCLGEENIGGESQLFGLQWHGKKEARTAANIPSLGTLRPCREQSKDWDSTRNLYIEGDNLEVLRLLQKSYHGRVKMIYIDPPYNTGKDFVYKDNFRDGLKAYRELTDNGDFKVNQASDGRYHSNWLNMMYPRLVLARELLAEDGVICISIDDHECTYLKMICDSIFGEDNFQASIIWRRKRGKDNSTTGFSLLHEYILVYSKTSLFHPNRTEMDAKRKGQYANPDGDPNGEYVLQPAWASGMKKGPIYDVSLGNIYFSERMWLYSKERLEYEYSRGSLSIKGTNKIDGNPNVYLKVYLKDNKGIIPDTIWNNVGNTGDSANEIKVLFDGKLVFDTPKPCEFIKRIIQTGAGKDDIILDFFSGSATTAHAVMKLNAEDGGSRRFIMVQLPEVCKVDTEAYKAGYANVSEIGKERIRRAGAKIAEEHPEWRGDTGFRVYKLDGSNFKKWHPEVADLREALPGFVDHLVPGRSSDDLLAELLLIRGSDLCFKMESLFTAEGTEIFCFDGGDSYVCLAGYLSPDEAEAVACRMLEHKLECALGNENTCAFLLDAAFAGQDAAKLNLVTALKQQGNFQKVNFI